MAISLFRLCDRPVLNETLEEVEMDYNGNPISVGFNARYLIDVLHVLGNEGN